MFAYFNILALKQQIFLVFSSVGLVFLVVSIEISAKFILPKYMQKLQKFKRCPENFTITCFFSHKLVLF